jgi:hypothetical protein
MSPTRYFKKFSSLKGGMERNYRWNGKRGRRRREGGMNRKKGGRNRRV